MTFWAGIALAAIIYAGEAVPVVVRPDSTTALAPHISWLVQPPATDDSGSYMHPMPVPPSGDTLMVHWRIFHLYNWPVPNWWMFHDDSAWVARVDSLSIQYPIIPTRYYITYGWATKWGWRGRPIYLAGLARKKLLVPIVP